MYTEEKTYFANVAAFSKHLLMKFQNDSGVTAKTIKIEAMP